MAREKTGAGSLRLAPGCMLVNLVPWLEAPCSAAKAEMLKAASPSTRQMLFLEVAQRLLEAGNKPVAWEH